MLLPMAMKAEPSIFSPIGGRACPNFSMNCFSSLSRSAKCLRTLSSSPFGNCFGRQHFLNNLPLPQVQRVFFEGLDLLIPNFARPSGEPSARLKFAQLRHCRSFLQLYAVLFGNHSTAQAPEPSASGRLSSSTFPRCSEAISFTKLSPNPVLFFLECGRASE